MLKKMTEEEYRKHIDSSDGLCINCGEITYGDTEPDAENYQCNECFENALTGIENALVSGYIEIVTK